MFVEYLAHKNPVIRAQTGCLLQRSLATIKASVLNKALIKLLLPPLLKVGVISGCFSELKPKVMSV